MERQYYNQESRYYPRERNSSRNRNNDRDNLFERIRRDVASWFDDDDDERRSASDERDFWSGDYDSQRDRDYANYENQRRQYGAGQGRQFDEGQGRTYGDSRRRQFGGRGSAGDYDTDFDDQRSSGRSGRDHYTQERWNDRDTEFGQDRIRQSSDYRDSSSSGSPWQMTYAEFWLVPGPNSGKGPKGFQRSTENVKETICERLQDHGELDASEIDVSVDDDEVTLKGEVCSRQEKRLAEQCAESVRGIRDVHNHLTVKRDSDDSRSSGSESQKGRSRSSTRTPSKSSTKAAH